ncbi:MAG: hypothetical protein NZO58_05085 [Gemmataceae bacterium]|nr:hypothetical protein [Gemmataceae bacterium]
MTNVLDREEYIEQAYFFRTLRERLAENLPTQQILEQLPQEILSITRLPMAIEFIAAEVKHTGQLASGFTKLPHYFTPFQAFVIENTEIENRRFSIDIALLILEREALYRAGTPTPAGLFVYEFETLSRNRLGYDAGLRRMREDGFFNDDWRAFLDMVQRHIGAVDFADLIYLRSELYVKDQRRKDPDYAPPAPVLFGEKEGKIAKANRGRDPLYLFAALQRQLGYPEVPRARPKDDPRIQLEALKVKIRELETRMKLLEGEVKGRVDLSEFMVKPDEATFPQDDE